MRALSILLLSATVWAGDVASHIHLVKITTDLGGGVTSTLAGAALCVGKDGLLMVVGFAVDKPSRDAARQIRVTVITPDGDERDARILRGHEDMRCTFIRLGRGKMPDPVPLQGAPLKVGEKAVMLGRYGETMRYATWRATREVEAVVTDPRTLYALRDVGVQRRGAIVATTDGRLVGFVDSRLPFPAGRGIIAGLGAQTMVVVPAADFADLPHKPPAKAWLGVNLAPFDKPREDYFNVSGDWRGALVTGMSEGSPAEKAGLKLHDLLQSIGDQMNPNRVRIQSGGLHHWRGIEANGMFDFRVPNERQPGSPSLDRRGAREDQRNSYEKKENAAQHVAFSAVRHPR